MHYFATHLMWSLASGDRVLLFLVERFCSGHSRATSRKARDPSDPTVKLTSLPGGDSPPSRRDQSIGLLLCDEERPDLDNLDPISEPESTMDAHQHRRLNDETMR